MLVAAGLVVAIAAAVRSTWSPCGLSMLSSITPFGERSRRHRYGVTAGWFVLGAVVGGGCLGAVAAIGAAVTGVSMPAACGVSAAVAMGGALLDAGAFGPVLPLMRRQVDDGWLSSYRPWVYGLGFGWQVGVGVATYVMTAGVGLVVALGVLSGSPPAALLLGVAFGLARGSTVLLTARVRTPAALRDLHHVLDRIGPAVRRGVAGLQAGVALALAVAALWAPARTGLLAGVAVILASTSAGVTAAIGVARLEAEPRIGTR